MKWPVLAALIGCGAPASSVPPVPPPIAAAPPPRVELVRRGSIAAGERHACAVTAPGKLVCWGMGGNGRLGTPSNVDQPAPVEVPGLDEVAGVAAHRDTTCAWTARGAAWCWGDDDHEARGGDHRPRRVPGIDDVVQVVVGNRGACGLRGDGHVACWSSDTWLDPLWPAVTDLAGIDDAVELAGSHEHLCARTRSAEVACWLVKDARHVELRDATPARIPELRGATSIDGRDNEFAAVMPGRRLALWSNGDLGPAPARPIRFVDDVDGERVVVGGGIPFEIQICALGARTTCVTAGTTSKQAAPIVAGIRDLAIGGQLSCARIADHAECSGLIGRLGDGVPELPVAPVEVRGITDARQLEVGFDTACVLRATGRVACWGARPGAFRTDGRAIIDAEPVELDGVTDAVEIAMGYDTVCARRARGVTCWDVAPDGTRRPRSVDHLASATRLLSGSDVCAVVASGLVECAGDTRVEILRQLTRNLAAGRPCVEIDGSWSCWHGAGAIQVGYAVNDTAECRVAAGKIVCHDDRDPARTFDEIPALDRVVSWDGTYAVTADGTVHTGNIPGRGAPGRGAPPVGRLANVVELRAGGRQLCARLRDGKVACWGPRDYLGAGEHGARTTPARVAGLEMGAARPYAAGPLETRPIARPPTARITEVRGTAMQGPFRDRAHACAAQTCAAKERRDCTDELSDPRLAMAAPPPPFSTVDLMAIDCRDPAYTRDAARTYRLVLARRDGYWVSAPLFTVGANEKYCAGTAEPRWEARDLIAGGAPEIALSVVARTSCGGGSGRDVHDVSLVIVAADAARPIAFAPIPTGTAIASGCAEDGCTTTAEHVKLDAVFAPDGTLAIGGPATWPAPERTRNGAFESVSQSRAKTPVGTYRFSRR